MINKVVLLPRDEYKRLVVHPKLNFKVAEWLSIDFNTQYTKTNIDAAQGALGALTSTLRISPLTPIYTSEGRYQGPGGIPGGNPIARINSAGEDQNIYQEITTIAKATFTPFKNLSIVPLYAHKSKKQEGYSFSKPLTLYNADETIFSQEPLSNQSIRNNFWNESTETLQISADYSLVLKENHTFSAFALYSQEEKLE